MTEAKPAGFVPVSSLADLETLDQGDILRGYMDFQRGDPEPGQNRGRAYWHGWRNAACDHGEIKIDDAMMRLAHEANASRRVGR